MTLSISIFGQLGLELLQMPAKTSAIHHKRRTGHHQKRTRHFVRVYSPYLPLILFIGLGIFISSYWRPSAPQQNTLAYATEMSITSLLSSTNTQRTSNGKSPLTVNSKLNSAAQAKANDMVARNYWSHNTPDGQAPWIFFTNAGYSYSKAGENLAYGFATSSETVTGWMNSPTHKDNLLDSGFSEVGFGFSNSNNFNDNGQQTVVVAMYGKPTTVSQSTPSTTSTPKSTSKSSAQPKAASTPATIPTAKSKVQVLVVDDNKKPVPNVKVMLYSTPREALSDVNGVATFEDVETGEHTAVVELDGERREQKVSVANDTPVVSATLTKPSAGSSKIDTTTGASTPAPTAQSVSRLSIITKGSVPLLNSLAAMLALAGVIYLGSKHSIAIHRYLRKGERYVLHHGLLDATIISFVWLCYVVTRTAGNIL